MSALVLPIDELAAMIANLGGLDQIRDAFVKDQTYRRTPIGQLAGRYVDSLRFDDYSDSTISNRERVLAWLSFDHPELAPSDVEYDLLRAFLEKHWADAAGNTKGQNVSTLRCFFAWAYEYDHIPANPAKKLKPPRKTETERRSHSRSVIKRLVIAQDTRRDRVAILMLYWCALRRDELRHVQFRHIDLGRRVLTVFGKGRKVTEQNIPEPLALELERLIQDRDPEPNEFLLYPHKLGRRGAWPSYSQEILWEDRERMLTKSAIDKWFQRCRERAGLDAGETKILMHELRHTAGTHAQEAGHDLLATQALLRHASSATTERVYVHVDRQRAVARVQRLMIDPLAEDEG